MMDTVLLLNRLLRTGPLRQVPLTSESISGPGTGPAGLSSSSGCQTGQPPSAELAGSCVGRLGSTPQPETGRRHKESRRCVCVWVGGDLYDDKTNETFTFRLA